MCTVPLILLFLIVNGWCIIGVARAHRGWASSWMLLFCMYKLKKKKLCRNSITVIATAFQLYQTHVQSPCISTNRAEVQLYQAMAMDCTEQVNTCLLFLSPLFGTERYCQKRGGYGECGETKEPTVYKITLRSDQCCEYAHPYSMKLKRVGHELCIQTHLSIPILFTLVF